MCNIAFDGFNHLWAPSSGVWGSAASPTQPLDYLSKQELTQQRLPPPFPWVLVFSTLPERVSWLRTCVLWKKLLPGGWGGDWLGTRRTLDGRGHVSPRSCASPGPPSDLPGTHFPSGQMNSWTRWTPQVLLVLSSCTFRSTFNLPLLGGGPVLFEVNPGGS